MVNFPLANKWGGGTPRGRKNKAAGTSKSPPASKGRTAARGPDVAASRPLSLALVPAVLFFSPRSRQPRLRRGKKRYPVNQPAVRPPGRAFSRPFDATQPRRYSGLANQEAS